VYVPLAKVAPPTVIVQDPPLEVIVPVTPPSLAVPLRIPDVGVPENDRAPFGCARTTAGMAISVTSRAAIKKGRIFFLLMRQFSNVLQ
jgi:hypothetical protein